MPNQRGNDDLYAGCHAGGRVADPPYLHRAASKPFAHLQAYIMSFKLARFGVLAAYVTLLGSCADTGSWHQRLTIYVMTPTGIVSGESVMRVEFREPANSLAAAGIENFSTQEFGEAVVVDLGDGRYLFALLPGFRPDAYGPVGQLQEAYSDAYDAHRRSGYGRFIDAVKTAGGGARPLPAVAYPMLVAFGDLDISGSVFEVTPDDLEAAFGVGYSLERMTVEITKDRITTGQVTSLLPWLPGHDENFRPSEAEYSKDVLPIERVSRFNFIRKKN